MGQGAAASGADNELEDPPANLLLSFFVRVEATLVIRMAPTLHQCGSESRVPTVVLALLSRRRI
eukprot:14207225-Heterocapsa_arctica.AAC.1